MLKGTRYEMDLSGLERFAADPRAKMLVLCSPHNPVGRVWSAEELRRVADVCLAHDVLMVCDEIHGDLIMPGVRFSTLGSVLTAEELGHALVCTAPSKTFNLAGLQCSNIFVPNERLREALSREFSLLGLHTLNAFAYQACRAAYEQGGPWLDELVGVVWENHRLVCEFVAARLPGVRAFPLEGTYLQWLDFSAWGMSPKELEHFMRDEALLYLDEGAVFGTGGAGFERVNLACSRATLQASLGRLLTAARARGLATA